MSNKIVKIILIASIVILIASIFFFFYSRSRQTDLVSDSQNQGTSGKSPKPFPVEEKTEKVYIINNQNDNSEIKEAFGSFLKEVNDESKQSDALQWADIKDNSGKIIDLGKFTRATGLFFNPGLWNILDKGNFRLFYCPFGDKYSRGIGVLVNAQMKGNYYDNIVKFAKEWEPSMIIDTKSVVFPNLNLIPEKIKSQNLKFRDISRGRVVDFKDENGATHHFYYKIIDEAIFFTNYLECFDKVSNDLEANEP